MRNRLDQSEESGCQSDPLSKSFLATFDRPIASRTEVPLSLFGPERYEPRYEYPLIVWLHSCGGSEQELEIIMPQLSMQNYVACAPRGTNANDACGRSYYWSQSRAACTIAEETVFAAIASASKDFSIARKRVFLAGFGSGGTMACRIALRYPRQFAGVVSICGQFPQNHQPLKNLPAIRQLPLLWMYGQESQDCGVEHICQTLPLLHSAKMSAMIRQYPAEDELLAVMLSDMNHWLMQLVTSQPSAMEDSVEESFSRN